MTERASRSEFIEIVELQAEAMRFYERAGNAYGPTARVAAERLASAARLKAAAQIEGANPTTEEED